MHKASRVKHIATYTPLDDERPEPIPASRGVRRAWIVAASTALACVAWLVLAAGKAGPHAAMPPQPAFDALRNEAANGEAFAVRQLAVALMDRYDLTASSDDLYEAVIWADRSWQQFGDAELLGRVTARYCGQQVVRWHLVCHSGE